ncbi:MAG: hypothetical protein EPN43_11230 [Jatrophihabitans sp.]|nr:MAG: hypothetical protein EPN43_11230 [Jatrophihabitans sp.]
MALLVLALGQVTGAQAASMPYPTLITSAVSSTYQSPCGSTDPNCGDPGVLVVQGSPFLLTVTLTASGTPAAFTKATVLTLTATGRGSLSPQTVTMPANTSQYTFDTVSYAPYDNNVQVSAAVGGKGNKATSIASAPSNSFTVLQTLKTDGASVGSSFADGAGPTACASVSATDPVCGYLVLQHGASTSVLLSTGSCAPPVGCNSSGTVTQIIADLTDGHGNALYSRTDPATLIINCYRTVCGQGGVSHLLGLAAGSGDNGALSQAPPCPAKNTIGADQSYCTDQVQNARDNADESSIYVLFFQDFRGSI